MKVSLLAFFAVGPLASIAADTLFKNSTAGALGFGDTAKRRVHWSDCSHQNGKMYVKPPYSVDKSDNCKLKTAQFGLDASGAAYVAKDVKKLSRLFPDIKQGDVVDFRDLSAQRSVLLTFKSRSLQLPYGSLPTEEEILLNEFSVAVGFAKIGNSQQARDLLEVANQAIVENATNKIPSSAAFFETASRNVHDTK